MKTPTGTPVSLQNHYGTLENMEVTLSDEVGVAQTEPKNKKRKHKLTGVQVTGREDKVTVPSEDNSNNSNTALPCINTPKLQEIELKHSATNNVNTEGVASNGREEPVAGDVVKQLYRPHQPSYFLPGKVGGVTVQLLIDTGCTTNLLSKRVFDKLSKATRATMEECESHGIMADGTRMLFFGLIKLTLKVRHLRIEETFVVGHTDEDAILGTPFLTGQECTLDFARGSVTIGNKELVCTDRQGRPLMNKVQIYRDMELPPHQEVSVLGRVPKAAALQSGVIEGNFEHVLLAASLNTPNKDGVVLLRCLNTSAQTIKLPAGTIVGQLLTVEDKDIQHADVQEGSKQIQRQKLCDQLPSHLQELFKKVCASIKEFDKQLVVARLLEQYQDIFSTGEMDIGLTDLVKHDIPVLPGTVPIKQPPHRLGPEKEAEVEKQVADMLKKGLIEPTTSAWSSPVVLVRKKDGSWRFCVDYRKLNAATQYDAYPLPRIDESLDALAGSRFFSTLDLASGYWQVPLTDDAQEKSTFTTRSGLWKWKVLPFGLTSAPATFQRLMESVLQGLHWKTLLLYLDDIIVIAPTFEIHVNRLEEVFQRLAKANLKLKPSKCELFQSSVKYLGHIVSAGGVATDPDKVKAIKEWTTPTTVKHVQAFLGLAGYYRQYINQFSTIAKPLSVLISKDTEWDWTEECEQAFQKLKQCLTEAPILGYPDPTLPYVLDTDASAVGVGAVLSQVQNGRERVIAYYSKTLAPPERNYCVTRRELLAVVKAVSHFRPYLYGRPFTLRTDHASLMWLCRRKEPSHQVARWLEILSEFKYRLEHRAGTKHTNADALSRHCIDCRQCEIIEKRDGGPTHKELLNSLKVEDTYPSDVHSVDLIDAPQSSARLQNAQSHGTHAVAMIYQSVQLGQEPTEDSVEQGDNEYKKLAQQFNSMRINSEQILQVCLAFNERSRWCTICPPAWRQGIISETHSLTHAGIQKTIRRLQLSWYWPGMHANVRHYINNCEVCQRAKHGGLLPEQGKRYCMPVDHGRRWRWTWLGPFQLHLGITSGFL